LAAAAFVLLARARRTWVIAADFGLSEPRFDLAMSGRSHATMHGKILKYHPHRNCRPHNQIFSLLGADGLLGMAHLGVRIVFVEQY
jgi:hypothetical protein